MQTLVDVHCPAAEAIVEVMEQLSPAEAKWLADKLEFRYTPKYGSWLNIAEIELSTRSRQCRAHRVPELASLAAEVAAWQDRRNAAGTTVDWRFTARDVRIKLKHLSPSLHQ